MDLIAEREREAITKWIPRQDIWVTHKEINAIFGEVSGRTLKKYRDKKVVTTGKHPFSRETIYKLSDINELVTKTITPREN